MSMGWIMGYAWGGICGYGPCEWVYGVAVSMGWGK